MKTHEENRKCICFLCLKKASRTLTDDMKTKIINYLRKQVDLQDPRCLLEFVRLVGCFLEELMRVRKLLWLNFMVLFQSV